MNIKEIFFKIIKDEKVRCARIYCIRPGDESSSLQTGWDICEYDNFLSKIDIEIRNENVIFAIWFENGSCYWDIINDDGNDILISESFLYEKSNKVIRVIPDFLIRIDKERNIKLNSILNETL